MVQTRPTRVYEIALALVIASLCLSAAPALGRTLMQEDGMAPAMAPSPAEGPWMAPMGAPPGEPLPPAPSMIEITWNFPSALSPPLTAYPEQMAKVGDMIMFSWMGTHDVWQIPDGNCPSAFAEGPGMTLIAPPDAGTASVTFDAPGTYWYACGIGSHCSGGMLIKVTVTA